MSFDKIFDLTAGAYFYFYNNVKKYAHPILDKNVVQFIRWKVAQLSQKMLRVPIAAARFIKEKQFQRNGKNVSFFLWGSRVFRLLSGILYLIYTPEHIKRNQH